MSAFYPNLNSFPGTRSWLYWIPPLGHSVQVGDPFREIDL